jgi:hypothetical protein
MKNLKTITRTTLASPLLGFGEASFLLKLKYFSGWLSLKK